MLFENKSIFLKVLQFGDTSLLKIRGWDIYIYTDTGSRCQLTRLSLVPSLTVYPLGNCSHECLHHPGAREQQEEAWRHLPGHLPGKWINLIPSLT